jgi:hypothetical protein
MRKLLAAIATALAEALRGSWQLIAGIWTWVRSPFSPPSAVPNVPDEVCNDVVIDKPIEMRIRDWARARATGDQPRLPNGITPGAARWVTSLLVDELEKVVKASPDAIKTHMSGGDRIAGVRPVEGVQVQIDQAERLLAIRARGASLSAAIQRSLAASEARRQRAEDLKDAPAF